MDGDTEIDRDLQEILQAGSDEPTLREGATPTQSTDGTPIKAGGREFKNLGDLAKAYGSLEKDYTKKSQLSANAKRSEDFFKQLEAHPELKDKIHNAVKTYNAGQPQATPRSGDGGLSKDVAALRSQMESFALQKEEAELRSKYSLDDTQVMTILQKADELGGGVPLEIVHRSLDYDNQKNAAHKDVADKVAADKVAKEGAQTVNPNAGAVAPSVKSVKEMSQEEVDAGMLEDLKSFGYDPE